MENIIYLEGRGNIKQGSTLQPKVEGSRKAQGERTCEAGREGNMEEGW